MTVSEKCQKCLLGGLEKFWGANQNLVPTVPKVLMVLYQEDILDEEVIQSWGTHVSKKYVDKETSKKVRKASEPLLKVSLGVFVPVVGLFEIIDRLTSMTPTV